MLGILTTIHARVYAFHLNLKSLLPFPRYCGVFRLFLLCEKNLQHRRGRRQGRKPNGNFGIYVSTKVYWKFFNLSQLQKETNGESWAGKSHFYDLGGSV